MSRSFRGFLVDGATFAAGVAVLVLAVRGGWCLWANDELAPLPVSLEVTPAQCMEMCGDKVMAWAPDNCICDIQFGEIVWGAL